MKTRVQLLIGAGLMAAVTACGGPPPQTITPAPIPGYLVRAEKARADSIAALRAAEEAKALRGYVTAFDVNTGKHPRPAHKRAIPQ